MHLSSHPRIAFSMMLVFAVMLLYAPCAFLVAAFVERIFRIERLIYSGMKVFAIETLDRGRRPVANLIMT
jgi:hypothetical protein